MPFRRLRPILVLTVVLHACILRAVPIKVIQAQGSTRGFLQVRSQSGELLGYGDLTQTVHGSLVTAHLVFRFRDGSVDDEKTTFSQTGVFRLLNDRHIQKGPFFPRPVDLSVTADGTVTSRWVDANGKEKIEVEHKDLLPDTYNGMVGLVLLNIRPDATPFKISYLAPTGKGRIVQLAIEPEGTGNFRDVGVAHSATIFRVHIEVGGVAGALAPILGKQPEDIHVWVLEGQVPALVREVGALYDGGPLLDIQLSGASFPR